MIHRSHSSRYPLLEDEGGTCTIIRDVSPVSDLQCQSKPSRMSFVTDCCEDIADDLVDFESEFKIIDSRAEGTRQPL